MCTLSWFANSDSYHVYFNRDEQRGRPLARAPEIYCEENVQFVVPLDPVGGGSWLGVNQYGLTLALLNFYQGNVPSGKLVSRGSIVRNAMVSTCLADVREYLAGCTLRKYAPFSLIAFAPKEPSFTSTERGQCVVAGYRWNGQTLSALNQQSPLTSSAVDFAAVSASRLAAYKKIVESAKFPEGELFRQFHRSHHPEKSHRSVCMHREDARTVSFSQVSVSEGKARYRYWDGPPCEMPIEQSVSIDVILDSARGVPSL